MWTYWIRKCYEKYYKYVYIILLILVIPLSSYGQEVSVALKEGYSFYKDNGESIYEGNNIMDNGFTSGVYLRQVKDKRIIRLDYDWQETGNTFSEKIPAVYEKVDFNSKVIVLSMGRYITKSIYLLGGVGYSINDMAIEMYIGEEFSNSIDNSYCMALTLGIDKHLDKHLYLFGEVRYLYNRVNVNIKGSEHIEDMSNLGVYGGLGWKF